jgi:hypothetical protein
VVTVDACSLEGICETAAGEYAFYQYSDTGDICIWRWTGPGGDWGWSATLEYRRSTRLWRMAIEKVLPIVNFIAYDLAGPFCAGGEIVINALAVPGNLTVGFNCVGCTAIVSSTP